MAFQGQLKEFSVGDILQLLGSQRKTGCLDLESPKGRANVYVTDGRLVSSRNPGLAGDDGLLRFLMEVHRLSDEQHRGILTIQRESQRDLEDLLINGRYIESEELSVLIERQILDELFRLSTWKEGTYRFDPQNRWPYSPLVRLPAEAAVLEVARRLDEQKRHAGLAQDLRQILAVRDLPDPDASLSEEECEIFGIVDGRRTIAEVIAAAPLTQYEGLETLFSMIENGWIELVRRRDEDDILPIASHEGIQRRISGHDGAWQQVSIARELGIGILILAAIVALHLATIPLRFQSTGSSSDPDVFALAQVRETRAALELYQREHGHYPDRLEVLAEDGWIAAERLRFPQLSMTYRPNPEGSRYRLVMEPAR